MNCTNWNTDLSSTLPQSHHMPANTAAHEHTRAFMHQHPHASARTLFLPPLTHILSLHSNVVTPITEGLTLRSIRAHTFYTEMTRFTVHKTRQFPKWYHTSDSIHNHRTKWRISAGEANTAISGWPQRETLIFAG